ncbi:Six-hairpin glycosidase [Teratosphaeria nubilosa]|uniref:Six-hairpin glycosidase n=1 Tax=Teratosphaeria nubilosa TaxID=161662 RepID=A0A6G1LED4_9PEZI|nr:Six-hairpin glycosidase [Teratosphaeria nubilosa]
MRSILGTAGLLALFSLPPDVKTLAIVARQPGYASNAVTAAATLQSDWYDESTGLWGGMSLWWNSANVVTMLANIVKADRNYKSTTSAIVSTVFTTAKATNGGTWTNGFYDDEGWWALAWIDAYDVLGGSQYLQAAEDIFQDLIGGLNGNCGGQWWDRAHTAVNSINNELFTAVAASLGNRINGGPTDYRSYAVSQVEWLLSQNLRNSDGIFQDGLDIDTCSPEGSTWSYNQGVIIGALVELNKLTGNNSYLSTATSIANSALEHMVDANGILTDWADYPSSDDTAAQFKGVFVRNLAKLQTVANNNAYVDFLTKNANFIWEHNINPQGQLGADWQGPAKYISAPSHSSAMDCLVAAAMVS